MDRMMKLMKNQEDYWLRLQLPTLPQQFNIDNNEVYWTRGVVCRHLTFGNFVELLLEPPEKPIHIPGKPIRVQNQSLHPSDRSICSTLIAAPDLEHIR